MQPATAGGDENIWQAQLSQPQTLNCDAGMEREAVLPKSHDNTDDEG